MWLFLLFYLHLHAFFCHHTHLTPSSSLSLSLYLSLSHRSLSRSCCRPSLYHHPLSLSSPPLSLFTNLNQLPTNVLAFDFDFLSLSLSINLFLYLSIYLFCSFFFHSFWLLCRFGRIFLLNSSLSTSLFFAFTALLSPFHLSPPSIDVNLII